VSCAFFDERATVLGIVLRAGIGAPFIGSADYRPLPAIACQQAA
jgi:hypothetical protein